MLALAASSFDKPSETFIRDHARTIAPGETILLCQDGTGADQLGSPVLSEANARFPGCAGRVRTRADFLSASLICA